MRPEPGAGSATECWLCRAGYYCPNDTANTMGIPCDEAFECPDGSSIPMDCRAGRYCPALTGEGLLCPAGYYCPNATGSDPYLCVYPFYCPANSSYPEVCPLGYMAPAHDGLRKDQSTSCRICPGGTYGNHSERLYCSPCLAGYYCPEGTEFGQDNPCPKGYYCPDNSSAPSPCPRGSFGKYERATEIGQCELCAKDHYSHLEGQSACRRCGSSASSPTGSQACTCTGQNRAFHKSDGSCRCQTGYMYYDEADVARVDDDSIRDCQKEVRPLCAPDQVRMQATSACVSQTSPQVIETCNVICSPNNAAGTLDSNTGRCTCASYLHPDEVCAAACRQNEMPSVTFEVSTTDSTTSVVVYDPQTQTTQKVTMSSVFSLRRDTLTEAKSIQVVNFWPDRTTGVIYRNYGEALFSINRSLRSYENSANNTARRRLLQAEASVSDGTGEIPNPLICLELEEVIIFRIWLADDRSLSHYPVYRKDHLYNTNPDFDYGDFEMLAFYILETNVTYNSFAFQFSDAGTYVFADAQEFNQEVIVTVMDVGAACSSDQHRIQPSSPNMMVYQGVKPERDINEAPDWGLIIGLLVFLAACILMLVIAVIVWRPRDAGFYPMKHWAPKYRSLGAPPPVPRYMMYDDDHWPGKSDELGPRPQTDGAEFGEGFENIAYKGEETLEDFNVRVFYDKLEDQNLHLASQLARHKEDLQKFYDKICSQNDELKNLINDLDPEKLDELERLRHGDGVGGDGVHGNGSGDIINVVGANVSYGGRQFKFTGGSGREADLMRTLKMLIDRLNSGQIQITPEMITQSKSGATHYRPGQIHVHGQSDLLRRQNAERLEQERQLSAEEEQALDKQLTSLNANRNKIIADLGEKLAFKLQGDLTDGEASEIIAAHERDQKEALRKFDADRDRQMAALRQKLAERRRKKQADLRDKHILEAEQDGLPRPPTPVDSSASHVHCEEALLRLLHAQEAAGAADAEASCTQSSSHDHVQKLSDMLRQQLDTLTSQGSLTSEQRDELVGKQTSLETDISGRINAKLGHQMEELRRHRMPRKRKILDSIREEQEQERTELSTRLIQEGKSEDAEFVLAEMDREHQMALEAREAELDADEAEIIKQLTENITNEHVAQVKAAHRDIYNSLPGLSSNIDPTLQQKLLDGYRRDSEHLNQQLQINKDRQLHDVQAKLAARRARRLADEQRKSEEMTAARIVDEQRRQMAAHTDVTEEDATFKRPEVKLSETSKEEKALEKEHERVNKEMRDHHKDELQKTTSKIDSESRREEDQLTSELDKNRQQMLREKRNKQAAELQARPNLTEEQMKALMASHANDLELLSDKLEMERQRQLMECRDKMAARKKRKMADLRRKQEAEATREMLTQKKELEEIQTKHSKDAEKKAIAEGVQENGEEDCDKVIRAVLAERHNRELRDLDKRFAAEKKIMVDDALNKLDSEYDKLRAELQKKQASELEALKAEGLSPEEYQQRRSQLLNKHSLELADLDRRQAAEQHQIEQGALSDWQLRYARAKLDLKEKHYQEFSEALRQFNPNHEGVLDAQAKAQELDHVRKQLEARRKEIEEQMQKEKKAYEKEEQSRIEAEIAAYNDALDEESRHEKERHERNMEALSKRKDGMIKDKKNKLQDELDRMKQSGASKEEQEQIMAAHQRDMQNLQNRLDADKLRMQSTLQERLRKKREDRLAAKQQAVKDDAEHARKEMAETQKSQLDALKKDELLTINEAINIDLVIPQSRSVTRQAAPMETIGPIKQQQAPVTSAPLPSKDLPQSYQMAAPIDEAELTALLMASPLYHKLEAMKKLAAQGAPSKAKPTDGEGYIDPRDAGWTKDPNLEPCDLNKINSRSFVIYKFGCFAADLLVTHCQHQPITLLLADKIPANQNLSHNAYRNSFYFDANNRILYMRAERLDNVGQFILVLVHTLAHIKSGDLRDDSAPDFSREFYRALSVLCDDLFLSRYRRDSPGGSSSLGGSTMAPKELLATLFDVETEDEKSRVVDQLLDTKLADDVDKEGVSFNKERRDQRLEQYAHFSGANQLRGLLGDTESKVAMATARGSPAGVAEKLRNLMPPPSTTGKTLLSRQVLPRSSVLSNMTGHAMWQTFANGTVDKERMTDILAAAADKPDDAAVLLQKEVTSLENKVDNLHSDLCQLSKSELALSETVTALEQELSSGKANPETLKKLNEARDELPTMRLKQERTAETVAVAERELAAAKSRLADRGQKSSGEVSPGKKSRGGKK